MKILQINAVYGHGSTGVIVRDLEKLCIESGIECFVASPDKEVLNSERGILIGNKFDHKLHALLCRINGKQAYYSNIATENFLRTLDEIRPDIVHLHNLHSNYINLNMLLKHLAYKNISTVITLHDCWFYTGGCFHYTFINCNKWQYNCGSCPKKHTDTPAYFFDCSRKILSDKKKYLLAIPDLNIVGVSEWISNEARKSFLGNSKITTIRNGVDLDVFKPTTSDLRQQLNLGDKYIILGPASKWLSPENKNNLEYFARNMREDEVLLLYGASDTSLQLPPNILMYGYTRNRNELAALYSASDVFANVSYEDSLSLINVEAQACGTPVVTFDSTGPRETVDNINSYSVAAGDIKVMLDKIRDIRNKTEFQPTSCREFVMQNFEIETQYREYINLYKDNFFCKQVK